MRRRWQVVCDRSGEEVKRFRTRGGADHTGGAGVTGYATQEEWERSALAYWHDRCVAAEAELVVLRERTEAAEQALANVRYIVDALSVGAGTGQDGADEGARPVCLAIAEWNPAVRPFLCSLPDGHEGPHRVGAGTGQDT